MKRAPNGVAAPETLQGILKVLRAHGENSLRQRGACLGMRGSFDFAEDDKVVTSENSPGRSAPGKGRIQNGSRSDA